MAETVVKRLAKTAPSTNAVSTVITAAMIMLRCPTPHQHPRSMWSTRRGPRPQPCSPPWRTLIRPRRRTTRRRSPAAPKSSRATATATRSSTLRPVDGVCSVSLSLDHTHIHTHIYASIFASWFKRKLFFLSSLELLFFSASLSTSFSLYYIFLYLVMDPRGR